MTQKRKVKDAVLLAADIVFVLEDVKFRWTRPEYFLLVDLIKGFQNCMARPVPEDSVPPPASSSVSSTPVSPSLSSSSGSLLGSNPEYVLLYCLLFFEHFFLLMIGLVFLSPSAWTSGPLISLNQLSLRKDIPFLERDLLSLLMLPSPLSNVSPMTRLARLPPLKVYFFNY